MEVNDQQDIENIEFDVIHFKVFKKKTGKVSLYLFGYGRIY